MLCKSKSTRLWATAAILLIALVLLHLAPHGEPVVPHQPLRDLPYNLARWTGREVPLAERIVQAVSVSDYTSRFYSEPAEPPIQLYVGYYASQRTGDTIHSPKNCLPGSGWDPIRSRYATILMPGGPPIIVNEYVIQKDEEKQLVFYWYQGRGRVVASEYAAKFWMISDAISRNRTDGALVRINTSMSDGEAKARDRLFNFAQLVFPDLDRFIPK